MKYKKEEVLEILKTNHRQRIQVEEGIPTDEEITYELTIRDWISNLELLDWEELSAYYSTYFQIEKTAWKFRISMQPNKHQTLKDFCEFIAEHATKPQIKSIKSLGKNCRTAAIFYHLKTKLVAEDIKAEEIKPSSKLEDFLDDFAFTIIEEVNRFNPKLNYEANELIKPYWIFYLGGLVIVLAAGLLENSWFLAGLGMGLLLSGLWMDRVGQKIPPAKFEFEKLESFRDLIELIDQDKNIRFVPLP